MQVELWSSFPSPGKTEAEVRVLNSVLDQNRARRHWHWVVKTSAEMPPRRFGFLPRPQNSSSSVSSLLFGQNNYFYQRTRLSYLQEWLDGHWSWFQRHNQLRAQVSVRDDRLTCMRAPLNPYSPINHVQTNHPRKIISPLLYPLPRQAFCKDIFWQAQKQFKYWISWKFVITFEMQYIVLFCAISPYIKTLNTVVWNTVPNVSFTGTTYPPAKSANFRSTFWPFQKHWELGQLWGLALLSLYFVLTFTVRRSSTPKICRKSKIFVPFFAGCVLHATYYIFTRNNDPSTKITWNKRRKTAFCISFSAGEPPNPGLYHYIVTINRE